jgi:hypothetical protein
MRLQTLFGGDLVVWLEPSGSIMIKTNEPNGDPVELTGDEARALAAVLVGLAADASH